MVSQQNIESLLVAVLSVNLYPVDRAWSLLPRFKENGLTVPTIVLRESQDGLIKRLSRAGYNRGQLNPMMALRVKKLMEAISGGELDDFDSLVKKGDHDVAVSLLCKVYGIGPWAAELAWRLSTS